MGDVKVSTGAMKPAHTLVAVFQRLVVTFHDSFLNGGQDLDYGPRLELRSDIWPSRVLVLLKVAIMSGSKQI